MDKPKKGFVSLTDLTKKNMPAKKYSAGSRTHRALRFELDIASGEQSGTVYIDIAKALSALNRKAYRQGLYYYIQSVEFCDNGLTNGSVLDISVLPDNWVTKQSYVRALGHYEDLLVKSNVPPAKYADFKVAFNSTTASRTTLSPVGTGTRAITNDEWNLSEFVVPDANGAGLASVNIHMLGSDVGTYPDVTSYAIIKGFGATRQRPSIRTNDQPIPDGAETDLLLTVNSEGEPELAGSLISENDSAPYDMDYYIGSHNDDAMEVTRLAVSAGAGRVARSGGFCAPLGLLKVDYNTDSDFHFVVNVAAGPYHGVYAERIV